MPQPGPRPGHAPPARPPAAPQGRSTPRGHAPFPLSQSQQRVGAVLPPCSQSAPRVTQSGALCTRFKGRKKLAAPEPSQSVGGVASSAFRPMGARGGGAGQAGGEWQEPHPVRGRESPPPPAARTNGRGRWAGRRCPCPGSGLGAGQEPGRAGSVCSAARKCTRMPPLSVSSAGARPGPAVPTAARPKEPLGSGRLLLPLTREARPNAPPGLPMPGKGSGPRVRDRRGAGRCVRAWRWGPRGDSGSPPALGALPRGPGAGAGGGSRTGEGRGRSEGVTQFARPSWRAGEAAAGPRGRL